MLGGWSIQELINNYFFWGGAPDFTIPKIHNYLFSKKFPIPFSGLGTFLAGSFASASNIRAFHPGHWFEGLRLEIAKLVQLGPRYLENLYIIYVYIQQITGFSTCYRTFCLSRQVVISEILRLGKRTRWKHSAQAQVISTLCGRQALPNFRCRSIGDSTRTGCHGRLCIPRPPAEAMSRY